MTWADPGTGEQHAHLPADLLQVLDAGISAEQRLFTGSDPNIPPSVAAITAHHYLRVLPPLSATMARGSGCWNGLPLPPDGMQRHYGGWWGWGIPKVFGQLFSP